MGLFSSGNCECCEKIGFEGVQSPWFMVSNAIGLPYIENLSVDISLITSCKVVFGGIIGACGNSPLLSPVATVKSYIEGGGRFWLQGEYGGATPCLTNRTAFNTYLSDLGSTMSINNVVDVSGQGCSDSPTRECIAGSANIAQGSSFKVAVTNTITGGTSVWVTGLGGVCVAVEQLGDGFLFVCGDSNAVNGCSYDNSNFFNRISSYADADII